MEKSKPITTAGSAEAESNKIKSLGRPRMSQGKI